MINYEDYESEVRYRSKKKKPRPKKPTTGMSLSRVSSSISIRTHSITENADSLAELIMHLVHAVEFAVG